MNLLMDMDCVRNGSGLAHQCLDTAKGEPILLFALRVVNIPQHSLWGRFNGTPLIRLNWARCQRVAQWVLVWIHIMLLCLVVGIGIFSKSLINHPVISFSKFWCLGYNLFCTPCISYDIVYCCLKWWSVILWWVEVSMQYLHYPICKF